MEDGDLLQPLWRYPVRWLTMGAARDRWSFLTIEQRRVRRAAWPRWRRAVLPVALTAFWLVTLAHIVVPHSVILLVPLWVLVGMCALVGAKDWIADGHFRELANADGQPASKAFIAIAIARRVLRVSADRRPNRSHPL